MLFCWKCCGIFRSVDLAYFWGGVPWIKWIPTLNPTTHPTHTVKRSISKTWGKFPHLTGLEALLHSHAFSSYSKTQNSLYWWTGTVDGTTMQNAFVFLGKCSRKSWLLSFQCWILCKLPFLERVQYSFLCIFPPGLANLISPAWVHMYFNDITWTITA